MIQEPKKIGFCETLALSLIVSCGAFLSESLYLQQQAHAESAQRFQEKPLSQAEIKHANDVLNKERDRRAAAQFEVEQARAVKKKAQQEAQLSQTCLKNKECYALAEAVYFETRNQPQLGQVLVAQVILNRTKKKQFPSTIRGVVYQKSNGVCQFSYVCELKDHTMYDLESKKKALIVARKVMLNQYKDQTQGADHYYNAAVASPRWAPKMQMVLSFADHKFLKAY